MFLSQFIGSSSIANRFTIFKKYIIAFRKYIYIVLLVLVSRFPPSIPFSIENKHLTNFINTLTTLHNIYLNEEMPAASMDCKPKHPIIILPGMGSCTLEAWQGMKDFRSSVWGKADMVMHILTDLAGWEKIVSLDEETGLDPPGIKVRPSNGISSSDYIMPLYWVWQKIVANLGMLGYDHKNLHVSSYDWRLDICNLETRDAFFTKLKMEIEMYHRLNNEKVVVLGHSFANIVMLYFFSWVETNDPGFVDKHIHALVSIGAPFLGSPKCVSGLISGESKSSVNLFGGSLMEFLLENSVLKRILNTWGSVRTLLPKGGNKIWKNPMVIIDGVEFDIESIIDILKNRNSNAKITEFIKDFTKEPVETELLDDSGDVNVVERCIKTINYLFTILDDIKTSVRNFFHKKTKCKTLNSDDNKQGKENVLDQAINDIKIIKELNDTLDDVMISKNIHVGPIFDFICTFKTKISNFTFDHKKILREFSNNVTAYMRSSTQTPLIEDFDVFKYVDPTKHKLPNAPNLKMYSFYGTGKKTECGYYYMLSKSNELKINTKINNERVCNGIIMCDGDGTVPLVSSGYMHYRGWKTTNLNPSGIKTIVREYKNDYNLIKGLRGGPKTSDHVDILGNHSLMRDIIKICCGEEEEIDDNIISNLKEICDEIDAR